MTITSRKLIRATTPRADSLVPDQDVTVAQERAAIERHRNLGAARGLLAEAILLRFPVVERQRLHGTRGQPRGPYRIADVAQDSFDNDQDAPIS